MKFDDIDSLIDPPEKPEKERKYVKTLWQGYNCVFEIYLYE